MPTSLILTFQGVFQAWGKHSFETYRPTELFPTRSGVTGLLAAAIGIKRDESEKYLKLDRSYTYAARCDFETVSLFAEEESQSEDKTADEKEKIGYRRLVPGRKMTDFHTVQEVRTVGKKTKKTEVTSREYLEDQCFTLAIMQRDGAEYNLCDIERAVKKPCFSVHLGRKSCPLCLPLHKCTCEANNLNDALYSQKPSGGFVYSEEKPEQETFVLTVRDVPIGSRCFDIRKIYCYKMEG